VASPSLLHQQFCIPLGRVAVLAVEPPGDEADPLEADPLIVVDEPVDPLLPEADKPGD
jgi:hypothetical protein